MNQNIVEWDSIISLKLSESWLMNEFQFIFLVFICVFSNNLFYYSCVYEDLTFMNKIVSALYKHLI
jgi:hypothetical protein